MRSISCLFILSILSIHSNGQSSNKVSGTVVDAISRLPLPFVTIALSDSSGKKVTAAYSDSTGHYSFNNLLAGSYSILYTRAGYDSSRSAVFVVTDTTIRLIDPVWLQTTTVALTGVTVTARKPVIETKIDGLVYNAGSEAQLAGGSVLDVLQRVPLLTVDPNGSISVSGSSSVSVYIDGRPAGIYSSNPGDYLALVAADRIDRVQVITHPSAKYDAEGAGAIVLIFTKKKPLNNLGGNLRIGPLTGAKRSGSTSGINLFYKAKRLVYSFTTDYTIANRTTSSTLSRTSTDGSFSLYQQGFDTSRRKSIGLGFVVDMEIDSLNSLNINASFVSHRSKVYSSLENQVNNTGILREYSRNTDRRNGNITRTISMAYNKRFKKEGRELSFLGYYSNRNSYTDYLLYQFEHSAIQYDEDYNSDTRSKEWLLQADYSHPSGKRNKWETGYKMLMRNISSGFAVTPDDPARSGDFTHHQYVYAGYLSFETFLGQWQMRSGLRYEHTEVSAIFNQLHVPVKPYQNAVPNILFSRTFKTRHSFTIGYTQAISRPTLFVLNPTVNFLDSLNFSTGNPALRPQVIHRINGGFTFPGKGGNFLRFGISGNTSRSSIVEIKRLRAGGIVEATWENIGLDRSIVFSTNLSQSITNRLRTIIVLNATWQERNIPGLQRSGCWLYSTLYLVQTFKNNLQIHWFMMVRTPEIDLQNRNSVIFPQYYRLSLNKTFQKDRIGASISIESFFTPDQPFTTISKDPLFIQKNVNYMSNQLFMLRLSYRFNKDLSETRTRARNRADAVPVE